MTESEWTCLEKYIRARADELGLRDWTIVLTREEPEDKDAGAEIHPIEGQKRALLKLPGDFRTYDPYVQRRYLTHELIHCHFQAASDIVRLTLWEERLLAHDAYTVLWSVYRRAQEDGIDGLAVEIAKGFPLIEWLKEGS